MLIAVVGKLLNKYSQITEQYFRPLNTRRNAALFAGFCVYAKSVPLTQVAPFPEKLLLRKTFSGALRFFGVLGAYFTRTSPPKSVAYMRRNTASNCACLGSFTQSKLPVGNARFPCFACISATGSTISLPHPPARGFHAAQGGAADIIAYNNAY